MEPIFQQLGLSLLLGLLVGLQREHAAPVGTAGMRTFPLATLLGTIAGILARQPNFGNWIVGSGLVGLTVVVGLSHWLRMRAKNGHGGITTDLALLVMYVVGLMLSVDDLRAAAVVVGGTVAVLLQFKPELHGFARRLGDEDLRAIMQFVLITCIVLPLLPNDPIDPYGVIRPWNVWLMVVLIVGMSLGGYIVYKFRGANAGVLWGGLLGGAVSSTATTVSYARSARADHQSAQAAAVVIMLASSVMYVRVVIEAAVVNPDFAQRLAVPCAIALAATLLAGLWQWWRLLRRIKREPQSQAAQLAPAEHVNPTQLRPAIVFGATYAIVLLGLAIAQQYLGQGGLFTVAAISGLSEVDALTLSTAEMAASDPAVMNDGWRYVLVGTLSNFVAKAAIAGFLGGWQFCLRVGFWFAFPVLTGLIVLALL